MSSHVRGYYSLTKPHVTYGNVLTVAAGFLLASGYLRHFDLQMFTITIIGTTLVIASACVLNNYLDQDIDRLMERTKNRAVANGDLPGYGAIIFSTVLGVIGITLLAVWVNLIVFLLGVAGFIIYVWLYGALSKRLSIHGTLVGSISGAIPIVAGYCAVSGKIDSAAVLLFVILFFWQFPEFFSIAIYRRMEYKTANIPVMPVIEGVASTKLQILIYTTLFAISSLLLTPFGYTGYTYFMIMLVAGMYWIRLAWSGLRLNNSDKWARQMFQFSLIILVLSCVMLSVGPLLP